VIRASLNTAETTNASLFCVNNLGFCELSFRIVAPPTVKRTTFEEDGGPDAWAVVSREFYYIKNSSSSLFDSVFVNQMTA